MPPLMLLVHRLIVIFYLPRHLPRKARLCLQRRPSGFPRLRMLVRTKAAGIHTSRPRLGCTNIRMGMSLLIRHTQPMSTAMISPSAALIHQATIGATIMILRH